MKDHFTGLCYTRPLPRKRPKYVAYELNQIFGVIGFPSIFHSNNGKEFTSKSILEMLKAMNANIMSVTGRPRKPSNQGSVENINKLIKRVTADLEETERQEGKMPNWTMLQGKVMGIVNKQYGKGANSFSAYESVFGMNYDPPIPCCSREKLRKCVTIDERMKLVASPRLDSIARQMYKFDEADDNKSTTRTKDEEREKSTEYKVKQKLDFGSGSEVSSDTDSSHLDPQEKDGSET